MVIITRSVDLSVGWVVGRTAPLARHLFIDVSGIPIVLVFLAAGALLGIVNGLLVATARFRLSPSPSKPCMPTAASPSSGRRATGSTPPTCRRHSFPAVFDDNDARSRTPADLPKRIADWITEHGPSVLQSRPKFVRCII